MITITKIIMDLKNHKKIKLYAKIKKTFGEELGESFKVTKNSNYSNNVFDIVWSLLICLGIANTQVKIAFNTLCISKGFYFMFLITYQFMFRNLSSTSPRPF
jgi:hypothetical protein